MKIGILETGRPPEELPAYAGFGEMVKQFINQTDNQGFEFEVYPVLDGHFPASAQTCDGWMITGSKFGVYEDLPWIQQLKRLVVAIHSAGLPLFGICFGHQVIAEALGGKVEKSDKGWGVGLHDYTMTPQAPDWMKTENGGFTLNIMHQDQVSQLPESAEVIARSEFCEYAALAYGDSIITFQGHPEFSINFETDLIESRQLTVVPADRATPALQRLKQAGASHDGAVLSGWAVDLFRRHSPS